MNDSPVRDERDAKNEAQQAEAQNSPFPIIGLGASAGGIQVLQLFFDQMPADSGMAFVVVMHLSPDYKSNLAQVLQQRTSMPVLQISELTQVAPNQVYVIPPSKHLAVQDSCLQLVDPQQPTGRRIAIDLFFRTLSAAFGPRAVAIVLSGTDSDGVIGIKHIKEQGGLTMAQDPDEAEFDSMPRAAIATGMVDWVLPVKEMPSRLLAFIQNEARIHVPPETIPNASREQAEDGNSGGPVTIAQIPSITDEDALVKVLRLLRSQTGHDFAHYKRATVLRRVARRLQVNLLEDIASYLTFLRTHPAEVNALLHDLLISVTNFFRDRDAFAALGTHVAQLFSDKQAGDQVRVWVAGCATGEEAYSVAMLLSEHASRLETPPSILVFATDLDNDVVQIARAGLYPPTIEADVSSERLRRFFTREGERYRIRKEIRDLVLFSGHNLLKDTPFSRLDLITCRNLLIYLNQEAQEAVFDIFHFALRPGGLLFLGASETQSEAETLFAPLDKPYRLYVRRAVPHPGWQIRALPLPSPSQSVLPALSSARTLPVADSAAVPERRLSSPAAVSRALLFGDLHFTLLERFAPPSVIVNENYDIVHLSEHAGQFLQFAGGEITTNLLKVVHPSLRTELRTALFRAGRGETTVTVERVSLELANTPHLLNLHVRPARKTDAADGFILIIFEQLLDAPEAPIPAPSQMIAYYLEDENQLLKEQLSVAVEQHEASLEEVKAANEELQAINEEMRSTTEELETSKEELQSTNEELTTLNQSLKDNFDELNRANSDLENLMVSTEIGTIFLDQKLRIKLFTPQVQEFFNLISTDIGRPLSNITHRLEYTELIADAERVLQDSHRREREVQGGSRWFLARVLPYRSINDNPDGVVLTFVDITERKRHEQEIADLNAQLQRALAETHHRVKNNLQVLTAVVDVQTADRAETVPLSALQRVKQHIATLATLHDVLTLDAQVAAGKDAVSLKAALEKLTPLLQTTAGSRQIRVQADEMRVSLQQSSSFMLLVNEMVSNALKHGKGDVEVTLSLSPITDGAGTRMARLEVCDDGSGFPADFDPRQSANMGLEFIESLGSWDLSGQTVYENRVEGGARVTVTFPLPDVS